MAILAALLLLAVAVPIVQAADSPSDFDVVDGRPVDEACEASTWEILIYRDYPGPNPRAKLCSDTPNLKRVPLWDPGSGTCNPSGLEYQCVSFDGTNWRWANDELSRIYLWRLNFPPGCTRRIVVYRDANYTGTRKVLSGSGDIDLRTSTLHDKISSIRDECI